MLSPAPAAAQRAGSRIAAQKPTAKPGETWSRIGALCQARGGSGASETALDIARIARDEFYRFGGHRIDENGRLFSFGVVESEQEEDDQNIPGPPGDKLYRFGYLGWWNVLGYWAQLWDADTLAEAAGGLKLKGFAGASRTVKDAATGDMKDGPTKLLPKLDVATALAAIDKVFAANPEHREVLKEAIIRAAINDVAWSAAFISAVMRKAKLADTSFSYDDAHLTYIHKGLETAIGDIDNNASSQFYRACPPAQARLREGDLVCYHRQKDQDSLTPVEVREQVLVDRLLERRDTPVEDKGKMRKIKRTHCDVVAHIDARAKLAYVIGGNVQQSVTVKQLRLRALGQPRPGRAQKSQRRSQNARVAPGFTLIEDQGEDCSKHAAWTMPDTSTGERAPHLPKTAAEAAKECSLNRKKWFVVLQAR